MSGRALGWAFDQRAPTQLAKMVLVRLADWADADGLVSERADLVERLAADVQARVAAVRLALRRLEFARLISFVATNDDVLLSLRPPRKRACDLTQPLGSPDHA
jgi:hypothetical protein